MDKAKTTAMVLLVVALALLGAALALVLSRGFGLEEMDWNNDGRTTIKELFRSLDIGKRPILIDGACCAEYFLLKDGMPVKSRCNDHGAVNNMQCE